MSPVRTILAMLAGALCAGAATAGEPDGPMATANASAAPPAADLDVAKQIDDYLKSSPVLQVRPGGEPDGLALDASPPERKLHGEISVGVGSHGYRDVYGRADIPMGKTGTVSIAAGHTRGGYFAGCPGYGDGAWAPDPGGYGCGPGFAGHDGLVRR